MRAHDLFELPLFFTSKFLLTCAPSPPPAPDYRGAAQAQGAANVDAARTQGRINNPNVVSPYGNQTVTWNGDTPTVTQTLSGDQQRIFNRNNLTSLAMSDLALDGATRARDVIGTNLDFSSLPGRPGSASETRSKVMDAMMSRVNEDVDRRKGLTESNLVAAGIPRGSKAYDDAMALEERTRTDAGNQAYLASGQEMTRDFNQDSQRRREALGEMLTERQTPLNEISALRSGSQVANPFSMPGYAQNSQVAAAPMFAATQAAGDYSTDVYNARAAQAGGLQAGLFGLGGAAMRAAPALMMSDRRLKSNIVRLGEHPLGIGWYEYDIDGRRERGVMADEVLAVKPEAVFMHDDGYMMVDYAQVERF